MATVKDGELAEYVAKLPPIYREILAAFPRIVPNRRAGYGLAFQTIAADFEERGLEFTLGQVIGACEQLEKHNLVRIDYGMFVYPTDDGEQLIRETTGEEPAEAGVPPLPAPPRFA
ncbi:MAG: hypothetical protein FJ291_09390 [Planctomycetes bacterium]|nr:hypothetical protein [Planctomycetota bacterium]